MNDLLYAVKMAYRKHVLNDESIGWAELDDILKEALCNKLGDDGFLLWLDLTKATSQQLGEWNANKLKCKN